jgi:hypothetical protein
LVQPLAQSLADPRMGDAVEKLPLADRSRVVAEDPFGNLTADNLAIRPHDGIAPPVAECRNDFGLAQHLVANLVRIEQGGPAAHERLGYRALAAGYPTHDAESKHASIVLFKPVHCNGRRKSDAGNFLNGRGQRNSIIDLS